MVWTRSMLFVGTMAAIALVPALGHAELDVVPIPVLARHFMPLAGTVPAPAAGPADGPSVTSVDLLYHGGAIQKLPKVYLVFWQWGGADPSAVAPYLQSFFNGVGGSNWSNIQTQYSEASRGFIANPTGQLAGVWFDDDLPTSGGLPPVPDVWIANEAVRAATHFGFDVDADYIIATPHQHNDIQFAIEYCAWHSSTTSGGHQIAYTDLPYIPDGGVNCGMAYVNPGVAGHNDGVSIVAGHEYAEAVTDPHLDAWYDANGAENADKCAWIKTGPGASQNILLPTGKFAVQSLWSNAIHGCSIGGP